MLNPGATIGIVGGGQLGRMLAMAAAKLGYRIIVLDPAADAPAAQVANTQIVAAYDDFEALEQLGQRSDVVTYEFENVAVETLQTSLGNTPVHPNTRALSVSQDRLREKTFFTDLGIETAPFFDCPEAAALTTALAKTGGGGILKTRRFGYDGKGQVRISNDNPETKREAVKLLENSPSILEGFVKFEKEVSIIAARNLDGEISTYDPAENVHKSGILHTSTVPADISSKTADEARAIAGKVLDALDYVGVVGVELFLMENGSLIANEFAPRVHNSGHWTEAACPVSQFEQHIRAISGLPLSSTERHSDCRMENLIGSDIDRFSDLVGENHTCVHLYGKSETRPGRKMGHFTAISPIKS